MQLYKPLSTNANYDADTYFVVFEQDGELLRAHFFRIELHIGSDIRVAEDPVQFDVRPFRDMVLLGQEALEE